MYGNNKDGLSPAARRLADLAGFEGDIAKILQDDPSLMDGLDEYMKWRDQETAAVTGQSEQPRISHPLLRKRE